MWRPGDPATIFLQMGGGLVSGIGGGAVGIALGFIVGQAATPQAMSALTATIAGGLAGVVIGSTLGVYVAGKESGGSGSLLGTVLGTAVAVPLGYEVLMGTSPGPSRLIMAVLLVEVIGPIVGYHVSASTVYASTPQEGRAQQVKTTPIGVEGGRIVLSFSL